jgi:adenylate kinase family enzyme
VALAEGDAWLAQGTNILLFGPPGVGKSHLAAALGNALIDAGYRVLFTRTTDLVQQLQAARQELRLAATIEKLDKFHLLVLDDLSYVQKSQAETSVLFELISARYERRSLLITANHPQHLETVSLVHRRLRMKEVHHQGYVMATNQFIRVEPEDPVRRESFAGVQQALPVGGNVPSTVTGSLRIRQDHFYKWLSRQDSGSIVGATIIQSKNTATEWSYSIKISS